MFVNIPDVEALVAISENELIQDHEMLNQVHKKLKKRCYLALTDNDFLIIMKATSFFEV